MRLVKWLIALLVASIFIYGYYYRIKADMEELPPGCSFEVVGRKLCLVCDQDVECPR